MKWLLVSPRNRRRASIWASTGVGAFLAGGLAGSLAIAPGPVFWGTAGFLAFVLCTGRALELWRVDEMVFDHRPPWNTDKPGSAQTLRGVHRHEHSRQLRHV